MQLLSSSCCKRRVLTSIRQHQSGQLKLWLDYYGCCKPATKRPLSTSNLVRNALTPYVDKDFSYSFGRSNWSPEYKTIGDAFRLTAKQFPDRKAVLSHHQNGAKTYRQLEEDVSKLTKSLTNEFGFKKGDRLGLWSANCYEFLVIQHAFARTGIIHCPLSPLYKSTEIEFALNKANIKALFMPSHNSAQLELNNFHKVLKRVDLEKSSLERIIYVDGDQDEGGNKFNEQVPSYSLRELLSNDGKFDENIASLVDPDDTAAIFFTSGTTGKPKGASLSHYTLYNNVRMAYLQCKGVDPVTDTANNCFAIPLFHAFAGMLGSYSLCIGLSITLSGYKYSAKSFVDAFNKHNCTEAWLVPTMVVDILNHCEVNNITCETLKNIQVGASSCAPELVHQAFKRFPNLEKVAIGYGATETGPVVTLPRWDIPQDKITDNIGTAGDGIEVKIINRESGKLVKHGEQGELLTRGHHIMQGYWEEPEKTAEVLKNGWYATGDMATMDSEGYFRIVGRVKELIIRGGANIYPAEVEELLIQHPDVLQVGVCGVPHPKLGEEVCAWIQLKEGVDKNTVTVQTIKEYCKEKISYYKVPQHVFFVDCFPMTASGKIQKFIMTEQTIALLKK